MSLPGGILADFFLQPDVVGIPLSSIVPLGWGACGAGTSHSSGRTATAKVSLLIDNCFLKVTERNFLVVKYT